jgi:hypothetical protein
LRLLAIAGLCGQLAAVADALFVEHVTCFVHGDRVHVTADAPVAAARWSGLHRPAGLRSPTINGDEHDHVLCLLDDDVDFIPPPAPAALTAPAVVSTAFPISESEAPTFGRSPLYRLAPKNSPPG